MENINITKQVKANRWNGSLRIFQQLPYVYFIGLLGLIYIANAHSAERKMRQIVLKKRELKEMRWKYISANANLKYSSTASYIEHRVSPSALKLHREPLVVIRPN